MTQLDPEQLGRPGAGGGRNLTSDVTDDRLAAVLAIQQEITLREPSLDEVLELVARRSLTITGASGAAIALHREGEMTCRARSGDIAPPLGAPVSADSGLSGECLRKGQTLHCDDADTDPRVNREAARAMGIRSAIIVPLFHHRRALGVFELFSSAPRAFAEQDLRIVELLAGLITTAISYSSEFEAKQALDSERTAMLQALEQIAPAIEKLLQKEKGGETAADEFTDEDFAAEEQAEEAEPDKAPHDLLATPPRRGPEPAGTPPQENLPPTPPAVPQPVHSREAFRAPRFTLPPDLPTTPGDAAIDREQEAIEAAVEVLLKREDVLFPEESAIDQELRAAAEFPSEAASQPAPSIDFFSRRPRPRPRPPVSEVRDADASLPSTAVPAGDSAFEPAEADEGLAGDLAQRAKGLLQTVLAGPPPRPEKKPKETLTAVAPPVDGKDVDLKAAAEAWAAVGARARKAEEEVAAEAREAAEARQLRWRNIMEFAAPAAVTVVVILAGILWLRTRPATPQSNRSEIEVRLPEPLPRPVATKLATFGQHFETPFTDEETGSPDYGFYVGRTHVPRAPKPRPERKSAAQPARLMLRLAGESAFLDLPVESSPATAPEAVEVVRVPSASRPKATQDPPAAQAAEAAKRVRVPYQTLQASVVQKVVPIYPQIALLKGAIGLVVLNVVIGKDGVVKSAFVESGNEFLGMAAQNAVMQWRFKPYLVDGKLVEVETEIQFRFVRD
ncbi:MAG TPA: TonB family protein [Terriglobales bacterium]|jgi:TonB family protein|nr:TonB family protein [Terriglobales bacterium]